MGGNGLNRDQRSTLLELGWTDGFSAALDALGDPGLTPARVAIDYGIRYLVETAGGPHDAALAARLQRAGERVAVGDWIALMAQGNKLQIAHRLPRKTAMTRKAPAARAEEQVLAANVDLIFLATAVGADFNLRRMERLLTVAYQSGAAPVVLLMKADLDDPATYTDQLAEIAPGVPLLTVSGLRGDGIDAIRAELAVGRTGVLIGSSGVGKSTLINRLLGESRLRTEAIHEQSGQGRHTTSHRQLLRIPGAGLIIDTPGLREIQLWAGDEALGEVFDDIDALASQCRFNDCGHQAEPACAVREALTDGRLDQERFASYRKLQRELRAIELRADVRLQIEARRKWKVIKRAATERMKAKRRLG
jgi:ribosome biogenesis GTPase